MSSSMLRSTTSTLAASMHSTPLAAAKPRLEGTDVRVATWPQSAAPSALPPMIAIW